MNIGDLGLLFQFKRDQKTVFITVLAAAVCLMGSIFLPTTHCESFSKVTLPCTVKTYGNAWDGKLAFDLSGNFDAVAIMDTNGTLLNMRQSNSSYQAAYQIAPDLLMFQGEPEVDGAATAPTFATHFWNLTTNSTTDFPNVVGHHDIQYDPVNHTFLTLQDYIRHVGNESVLFDKIVQLDAFGNVLWSWDTYDHIPLSEADPFNLTTTLNGQTVVDFAHANSLDWHYADSIIYLNLRHTNTFYKINQTTGTIIWACGQFGNFTLLGENGKPLSSLWYHSHNTKEVSYDVFTMFDNDIDNVTNPYDCYSRMIEVTLNENSMTAYVSWSWEAPKQYWNPYGGATLILPNGDIIGDFGDPSHQYPQNKPWDFNNTGAVFVEVNPQGQIIRTFTFPIGWYVYHLEAIINPPHTAASISPFTIGIISTITIIIVLLGIVIYRKWRAT